MARVGFEPATPLFEWVKTEHALGHSTSVFGILYNYPLQFITTNYLFLRMKNIHPLTT
jgi:hypothetical protein